jgi:uncharacterized damage-inducible protein DinB
MQTMFQYNWTVRKEWFKWCEEIPLEELLKVRTGGVGGILHTLFHIIDVEWSWIRCMQGKPDFQESFTKYQSLDQVKQLEKEFKKDVEEFVLGWNSSMEHQLLHDIKPDGTPVTDKWGEIMRHMIAHEIHHIGQLSVWAREIGKQPVSANLIGKGLLDRYLP